MMTLKMLLLNCRKRLNGRLLFGIAGRKVESTYKSALDKIFEKFSPGEAMVEDLMHDEAKEQREKC
jgi:hypothetical protein